MIWLALLIPLIAIGTLAKFYHEHISVPEYFLLFIVPIICIVIGKYSSTYSQTHDTEYWNSYGNRAMYEERWDEEVPCTHERYRTETYTDSDGKTQTREVFDGYEHSYDVDNHPECWNLYDNIGNRFSISKKYFEQLCITWGMRKFKDMHRDYHSIDGDAYETKYDNVFEHTVPICETHRYENRIQCSKSVFNFRDVSLDDKEFYGLFEYPEENVFGFKTILGGDSSTALLKLQKYNALVGFRRQLHMMILVFKDKPLEASLFQESYWRGGNKNEFILCIGTKNGNIAWTKVISWTEQEALKIKVAREVKEMGKLELVKVVDYIGETVPKSFIRKEFEDFSYISVRPTNRAILITFFITLLVTIVISIIAINNNY